MVQFYRENKKVVTNPFFELPNRGLYTCKSSQDTEYHMVWNQTDYIPINERYKNSIVSIKTYPGADILSNYNHLVANKIIKLKELTI